MPGARAAVMSPSSGSDPTHLRTLSPSGMSVPLRPQDVGSGRMARGRVT